MAKKHGAKQQKKLAKQKAKRQAKRAILARRTSKDPALRLQHAEKWPILRSLASAGLWEEGIGYLVIAREDPEGATVFASFLVDVFCLGVKDASWDAGSPQDFRDLVGRMEEVQDLEPIGPACLAKIVRGAVEFAKSFGFSPHPDHRHAAMLLAGIDPSTCGEDYEFGRDGKPLYIQGPNESPAQAMAIVERMREVGGDFVMEMPGGGSEVDAIEDDPDDEGYEDDEEPGESGGIWRWPGSRR